MPSSNADVETVCIDDPGFFDAFGPRIVLRNTTDNFAAAIPRAAEAGGGRAEGHRKDDAVAALCDLYVLLRQDDRYSDSEMLQQDAAKIRRRLLTVSSRRKARLKREKTPRPASLSRDVDAEISKVVDAEPAARGRLGKLAFQGGQAAGGIDNGWQLVELIQRIIEPNFWDTQGGPGTIRYFAMRRVLVVRATSDVHEQIRDLLMSLPW